MAPCTTSGVGGLTFPPRYRHHLRLSLSWVQSMVVAKGPPTDASHLFLGSVDVVGSYEQVCMYHLHIDLTFIRRIGWRVDAHVMKDYGSYHRALDHTRINRPIGNGRRYSRMQRVLGL